MPLYNLYNTRDMIKNNTCSIIKARNKSISIPPLQLDGAGIVAESLQK